MIADNLNLDGEMMRFLLVVFGMVALLALLVLISMLYEWIRRKTNKPNVGLESFLLKMLKHGDYVCIEGRVMRYSHITRNGEIIDPIRPPLDDNKSFGGELAFETKFLSYLIYPISALRKCEFIYGKYGLKWACNSRCATEAMDKIQIAMQ